MTWLVLTKLFKAGLTNLEVDFDEWQWEEEVTVLTLEHVGLGKFQIIS